MTIRQRILTFVRVELKGAQFTIADLRPLHLTAVGSHLTELALREFIAQIGLSAREGKAPPRKIYELRNPVYTASGREGRERFSRLNDNAWRDVFPELYQAHQVPEGAARKMLMVYFNESAQDMAARL